MVIACYNSKAFDLRILFQQDLSRELCILYCRLGEILYNNPFFFDAVFLQPGSHLVGFREFRFSESGAPAGQCNESIRILPGTVECNGAAADELLSHRPVRVELIAEYNDAQAVILRQSIREAVIVDFQIGVDKVPDVHYLTPGVPKRRIHFFQFANQTLDFQIGGRSLFFIGIHDIAEKVVSLSVQLRIRWY